MLPIYFSYIVHISIISLIYHKEFPFHLSVIVNSSILSPVDVSILLFLYIFQVSVFSVLINCPIGINLCANAMCVIFASETFKYLPQIGNANMYRQTDIYTKRKIVIIIIIRVSSKKYITQARCVYALKSRLRRRRRRRRS